MRKPPVPFPGEALSFPLPLGFFSNLPLVFPQRRGDFCPPWRKISPKPGKAQVKGPSPGFSPSFTGVSPTPLQKRAQKSAPGNLRRQIEKALAARPENPGDVPRGRQPKGPAKPLPHFCHKMPQKNVFLSLFQS